MKNYLLAERYAGGLVASMETQELDAIDGSLAEMVELIQTSPELTSVLYNDTIALETRLHILREVLSQAGCQEILIRLGETLLRRGRIRVLSDVGQRFSVLVDRAMGRARAIVTTALPLDETQQEALRQSLQVYNKSDIHLYCESDPEILGGVIAQIGSVRIDGSVRNRLRHLREALLTE